MLLDLFCVLRAAVAALLLLDTFQTCHGFSSCHSQRSWLVVSSMKLPTTVLHGSTLDTENEVARVIELFKGPKQSADNISQVPAEISPKKDQLQVESPALPYSDKQVKDAALSVVGASFFFVASLYYLISRGGLGINAELENTLIGAVAVLGAIVTFGSSGIVFKMPSLQKEDVDPVVFQLYSTMGIAGISLPLLAYLVGTEQFQFEPWGLAGALDTTVTSAFSFLAVKELGYAVAPAVWAGIGMISAFTWGVAGFHEPVQNLSGALLAVTVLAAGVFGIATSKEKSVGEVNEGSSCQSVQSAADNKAKASGASPAIPFLSAGIIFCLLTGVFDGTLMVPFKMHELTSAGGAHSPLATTLNYLCSLGLGSLVTTPALFAAYTATVRRGRGPPALKPEVALWPGVLSGLLWGPGQLLSVHATEYLGMSVGFPLTQTCIFVNALWGVLFFREADPGDRAFLARFLASAGLIVLGAALLSVCG